MVNLSFKKFPSISKSMIQTFQIRSSQQEKLYH